jgi:hypothetical protein
MKNRILTERPSRDPAGSSRFGGRGLPVALDARARAARTALGVRRVCSGGGHSLPPQDLEEAGSSAAPDAQSLARDLALTHGHTREGSSGEALYPQEYPRRRRHAVV